MKTETGNRGNGGRPEQGSVTQQVENREPEGEPGTFDFFVRPSLWAVPSLVGSEGSSPAAGGLPSVCGIEHQNCSARFGATFYFPGLRYNADRCKGGAWFDGRLLAAGIVLAGREREVFFGDGLGLVERYSVDRSLLGVTALLDFVIEPFVIEPFVTEHGTVVGSGHLAKTRWVASKMTDGRTCG